MALTYDKPRTYHGTRPDAHRDLLVEASALIYQGSALGLDGGFVQKLVAGDVFVGFAEARADNSDGADGDISVRAIQRGVLRGVSVTGISAVSGFTAQAVYMSDDNTFTTTSGGNSLIGRATAVNADGTCDVVFGVAGTAA